MVIGGAVDQLAALGIDDEPHPGEHHALGAVLDQERPVWSDGRDLHVGVVADDHVHALELVGHIHHWPRRIGQRPAGGAHVSHGDDDVRALLAQARRLGVDWLDRIDDPVWPEGAGARQLRDIRVGEADEPDADPLEIEQERRQERRFTGDGRRVGAGRHEIDREVREIRYRRQVLEHVGGPGVEVVVTERVGAEPERIHRLDRGQIAEDTRDRRCRPDRVSRRHQQRFAPRLRAIAIEPGSEERDAPDVERGAHRTLGVDVVRGGTQRRQLSVEIADVEQCHLT